MNQSINTDSKNSKEPQQKYRLGTVSIKILGGLNRFYRRLTSPSASIMAQNIQLFGPQSSRSPIIGTVNKSFETPAVNQISFSECCKCLLSELVFILSIKSQNFIWEAANYRWGGLQFCVFKVYHK